MLIPYLHKPAGMPINQRDRP